jgi:hypothetical protein
MDNVVFHCNHTNTYAMKKLEKEFQHLHKKTPQQKPIKNTHTHTHTIFKNTKIRTKKNFKIIF